MSYSLILNPSIEKDLRSLPKTFILKAVKQIIALQDDPIPHQAKKIVNADGMYRVRVGDYRIVYSVSDQDETITILRISHRSNVYRHL